MTSANQKTSHFQEIDGESFYRIDDLSAMPEFFMTLVSSGDHWLFISSLGALSAGRGNPEQALFPYDTVDKICDSRGRTGSRCVLRLDGGRIWEPFADWTAHSYRCRRALYRNSVGSKVIFEETNLDLGLMWRSSWSFSHRFGFIRTTSLQNTGSAAVRLQLVDGFLNLMCAGTPRSIQTHFSCLSDAYKDGTLDPATGLAAMGMSSLLTDRAEPMEGLRATAVWYCGAGPRDISLQRSSLEAFLRGEPFAAVARARGRKADYLVRRSLELAPGSGESWSLVADVGKDHRDMAVLRQFLAKPAGDPAALLRSEAAGIRDELERLTDRADGASASARTLHAWHHRSNVLFNIMRGGLPAFDYQVPVADFLDFVRLRHPSLGTEARQLLGGQESIDIRELTRRLAASAAPRLRSLGREYLPLTFSRRHGDPSRPWNNFAIKVRDGEGKPILDYQGNWRDIFQNWEALALSWPGFLPNFIATFLGAMTLDGYNPYRITREGVDWEKVEPDNPWANIGYWNDHQIIYFQKLAELQEAVEPGNLMARADEAGFPAVQVPYRIADWAGRCADPRSTISFDHELDEAITRRVAAQGSDGRLVQSPDGEIRLFSLNEKLLIMFLAKLGNLVPGGGIWMNTQRPEWNDANNALVGNGLSLVTVAYLRRFAAFWQERYAAAAGAVCQLDRVLADHFREQDGILASFAGQDLNAPAARYRFMAAMGASLDRNRERVYAGEMGVARVAVPAADIAAFLARSLELLDASLTQGRRGDGLWESYSLLSLGQDHGQPAAAVRSLYPMLEGQVAVLSSGYLSPAGAAELLERLPSTALYRADADSYLLYPWRELPDFFAKNAVDPALLAGNARLEAQLAKADRSLLYRDVDGAIRFGADLTNHAALSKRLEGVEPGLAGDLHGLYEKVFHHDEFTGRSGTMYAYEGLGSIYWHMVAKLLAAIMEIRDGLGEGQAELLARLDRAYLAVRRGIGYQKTPQQWGAFPWEPYSHTPKDGGAQQPGMTGQVKEEVRTRFGEFGLVPEKGGIRVLRTPLLEGEFLAEAGAFRYLDVDGTAAVLNHDAGACACTLCQVPVIRYRSAGLQGPCQVRIVWRDGRQTEQPGAVGAEAAAAIFGRTGQVRAVEIR